MIDTAGRDSPHVYMHHEERKNLTMSHFLDFPRSSAVMKSRMRYLANRKAMICPMPPPIHTASSAFQNLPAQAPNPPSPRMCLQEPSS